MDSRGKKSGDCRHVIVIFDLHKQCARCHDKGLGDDPCILKRECEYCNSLTAEQKMQLSTPSYKASKEKRSATPAVLVNPAVVNVVFRSRLSRRKELKK